MPFNFLMVDSSVSSGIGLTEINRLCLLEYRVIKSTITRLATPKETNDDQDVMASHQMARRLCR